MAGDGAFSRPEYRLFERLVEAQERRADEMERVADALEAMADEQQRPDR